MMIVISFFVWEDLVCLVIIITIIIITIKFDACAATDSAWRWTDAAVCSRVTAPHVGWRSQFPLDVAVYIIMILGERRSCDVAAPLLSMQARW